MFWAFFSVVFYGSLGLVDCTKASAWERVLIFNLWAKAAPTPLKGPGMVESYFVALRRGDAFPQCYYSSKGVTIAFLRTWASV